MLSVEERVRGALQSHIELGTQRVADVVRVLAIPDMCGEAALPTKLHELLLADLARRGSACR